MGSVHYAPKTPLYLYESAQKLLAKKSELTENDLVVVHDQKEKQNFGDTVFSILTYPSTGKLKKLPKTSMQLFTWQTKKKNKPFMWQKYCKTITCRVQLMTVCPGRRNRT